MGLQVHVDKAMKNAVQSCCVESVFFALIIYLHQKPSVPPHILQSQTLSSF